MVGYIPLGSSTQVTDWYLFFKGLPNLNHSTKEEQLECVTLYIFQSACFILPEPHNFPLSCFSVATKSLNPAAG